MDSECRLMFVLSTNPKLLFTQFRVWHSAPSNKQPVNEVSIQRQRGKSTFSYISHAGQTFRHVWT